LFLQASARAPVPTPRAETVHIGPVDAKRSHRSRSAGLRGEPATDLMAKIVAKCDRNIAQAPLIFIRRPEQ
jgi:hypothetical protein